MDRPPINLMEAIKREGKSTLRNKGTVTRVRYRDGRVCEEVSNHDGSYRKISEATEVLSSYLEEDSKGFASLPAFVFEGNKWTPSSTSAAAYKEERQRASHACMWPTVSHFVEQDDEGDPHEGCAAVSAVQGSESCCSGKVTASPEASSRTAAATARRQCGTLKLVTYNVWFAREDQLARAAGLLGLIETEDPDVVCLQEVTAPFLEILLALPWVRRNFVASDGPVGATVAPYGVVLLVRRATAATPWLRDPAFTIHSLPSNMGRRALFVTLADGGLIVGTAHLESLANTSLRVAQLGVIGALFRGASPTDQGGFGCQLSQQPAALFAGDTNFGERHQEEVGAARAAFGAGADVWPELHRAEEKETHTMLREKIGRIDKVYCHEGGGGVGGGDEGSGGGYLHPRQPTGAKEVDRRAVVRLRPTAISLLGKAPCHVNEDGRPVFPSDHAGVLATFALFMAEDNGLLLEE